MISDQSTKFQMSDFYDALMSQNVKQKLKPFLRQFKKRNVPFIYEAIANLVHIITGKGQSPLMKFNALYATKLFFDTGEYVPTTLIEIYLLPLFFQIASYRIQKRSQEGLTLYFIEKGHQPTKQMKRIGFNYVLLAIQFIFITAQVRPYRTLENQQLTEESNYFKLAKILKQKGVPAIEKYTFYIPSYVGQTRKKFVKRLKKFNESEYVDFVIRIICEEINLNKKPEIDLKKILIYGDAYITVPLMHVCEDQLSNMQTNFVNKKKYLILLGDFMKWGDIYAVLIISRSTFLENIFEEIKKVRGQLGLEYGETIYPKVEATKSDKKEFYNQFLKYIQIWAYCHPMDENNQPTDAKSIFDYLKNEKKFVFPPNILLGKMRNEMQANLKQNNQRNLKILRLFDESSSYETRRKQTSSFKQSRLSRFSKQSEYKIPSLIELQQLEQIVIDVKNKLNKISQKDKLNENIRSLQKFLNYWGQVGERNDIEQDSQGQLQIIVEQGNNCQNIIEMILPIYQLYAKQAISFAQYQSRIQIFLKKQQHSISIDKHMSQSSQLAKQKIIADQVSQHQLNQDRNRKPKETQNKQAKQQNELVQFTSQQYSSLSNEQYSKSSSELQMKTKSKLLQKQANNRYELSESREMQQKLNSNVSYKESDSFRNQNESSQLKQKTNKQSLQDDNDHISKKRGSSIMQQDYNIIIEQPSNIKNSQSSSKIGSYVSKQERERQYERHIRIQQNYQIRQSQQNNSKLSSQKSRLSRSRNKIQSVKSSNISKKSQHNSIQVTYKDIFNEDKKKNYQYKINQSYISSEDSQAGNRKLKNQAANSALKTNKIDMEVESEILHSGNQFDDYYGHKNHFQLKSSKNSHVSSRSSKNKLYELKNVNQHIKSSSIISSNSSKNNKKNGQISKNMKFSESNSQFSIQKDMKSIKVLKQKPVEVQNQKQLSSLITNPYFMTNNDLPLSILSKHGEQSIIQQPQNIPLSQTFHEDPANNLTSYKSKVSSFKECFEIDNEVIQMKEKNKKLLSFSKNGKIVNIIQNTNKNYSKRGSSIIDILSERNAKNSIQTYRNERQKIKIAENLTERIRSLESFNKTMRVKNILKNQALRSSQNMQMKYMISKGSNPVSIMSPTDSQRLKSEGGYRNDENANELFNFEERKGNFRQINKNIYAHYFPQNKNDRFKKTLIKNKNLIYKTEQFEIGCVMVKKQRYLDISFFITPLQQTIEDIIFSVACDQNLKINLSQKWLSSIKKMQQQHLGMQCYQQSVPYFLPSLSIKFQNNPKYRHNQILVPIPCSFNKYVEYHPIPSDFGNKFQKNKHDIIATNQFQFNTKIIKLDKIKEILPQFTLISKDNNRYYYGSESYYLGKIFLLRFVISEKGWMILQAKNMTGDQKGSKFIQFLLTTFQQIFEKVKSIVE